jgi:hypothetical protein
MNLYDVMRIESQIEASVDPETGEIDEELLQDLIHAQTRSIEKVEQLCKYVKHLENFIGNAKEEKARINDLQKKAENRIESIKGYMLPYIKEIYDGRFHAGTFKISTLKSHAIELDEGFNNSEYMVIKQETRPDKIKITNDIKDGKEVPGAKLVEKENLQIK